MPKTHATKINKRMAPVVSVSPPTNANKKSRKSSPLDEQKLLAAAVGDCLPPPRSVTVLQFCELADKYGTYHHRLPALALHHTFCAATFNETSLATFLGELESSWHKTLRKEKRIREDGKVTGITTIFSTDAPLKDINSNDPGLTSSTLRRLVDSLAVLEEKHRTACCNVPERDAANAGKCLPLSELATLGTDLVKVLQRKRPTNKAILQAALPLVEAFRTHPGVDGRPSVYSSEERAAANAAEKALNVVGEKFPFLQRYTDPPHVMAITNITAPPNLQTHFPAHRLAANPIDASDGGSPDGLLTFAGQIEDARWAADLLRSHYYDVTGGGAPHHVLPTGPPMNVRIMSFSTTLGNHITYH